MRISSITKNAGKACNNRLYRHIRTFEKIVKNYFVIYLKRAAKRRQESWAGQYADREDGTGKWVRYDENGHIPTDRTMQGMSAL